MPTSKGRSQPIMKESSAMAGMASKNRVQWLWSADCKRQRCAERHQRHYYSVTVVSTPVLPLTTSLCRPSADSLCGRQTQWRLRDPTLHHFWPLTSAEKRHICAPALESIHVNFGCSVVFLISRGVFARSCKRSIRNGRTDGQDT